VNEQDTDLRLGESEEQALRWLGATLGWEAALQRLRMRADLALAGPPISTSPSRTEPRRDSLNAVASASRPDLAGWDEHLDRTA
jgi:hypothetical protein